MWWSPPPLPPILPEKSCEKISSWNSQRAVEGAQINKKSLICVSILIFGPHIPETQSFFPYECLHDITNEITIISFKIMKFFQFDIFNVRHRIKYMMHLQSFEICFLFVRSRGFHGNDGINEPHGKVSPQY